MTKYILRLDDACPFLNFEKWDRIESLCEKYNIKPLVGIIPDCKDPDLIVLDHDSSFWTERVQRWKQKEWCFALHGYNHVFLTEEGGINPVNKKSEFAGVQLGKQKNMIKDGVNILKDKGIIPKVFFAPAHTFDENTLKALLEESDIRIISDTPGYDTYSKSGFIFIPQQSGRVRWLPFRTVTFCYHPNSMDEDAFIQLESFLKRNKFTTINCVIKDRNKSILDNFVSWMYFRRKRL